MMNKVKGCFRVKLGSNWNNSVKCSVRYSKFNNAPLNLNSNISTRGFTATVDNNYIPLVAGLNGLLADSFTLLRFLKEMTALYLREKLQLKFSRWSIFPVVQGVDFLGYRHFPNKILLRKSTAKRVAKRLKALPELLNRGKITLDQYRSSLASTEGWIKWASTYNLKISLNINKLNEALIA